MKKHLLMSVAIVTIFATVIGLARTPQVGAEQKIDICHFDNNVKKPYGPKPISVSISSVDGVGKGDHFLEHTGPVPANEAAAQALKDSNTKWGDIIPPTTSQPAGLNWTALGQAMYNNGCQYVTPVTPIAVSFVDPTCSINASYTVPTTTGVVYKINGTKVDAGEYPAITGQTVTIDAFAQNSGYILEGTTTWSHTFVRSENCEIISTTPADVIFTNPTCKVGGSYTIPITEGVAYKIDDQIVPTGTYPAANGTQITVTAEATSEQYEITGTDSWSHTYVVVDDCASDNNGVVLGTDTKKPTSLPVTSSNPTVANVAIASAAAGLLTALSLVARSVLSRKF